MNLVDLFASVNSMTKVLCLFHIVETMIVKESFSVCRRSANEPQCSVNETAWVAHIGELDIFIDWHPILINFCYFDFDFW